MAPVRVAAVSRLDPPLVGEVMALVAAAESVDGVPPLNDHTLAHVKHGDTGGTNLIARDGDRLVGFAHLDTEPAPGPAAAELVVAPAARGRGVGGRLLAAVIDAGGNRPLQLWAHGRLPAAERLASRHGFRRDRVLLRMARPLGADPHPPLPQPRWADGVAVRTFRVGHDEPAWLRVNARAFAGLPDQGGWRLADLHAREAEPWFDPAGFFLAERDGQLVGFHWTKLHGGRPGHAHGRLGEVYVIGVDPDAQGLGLGRALLLHGLHHLSRQEADEVMLYVDDTNRPAIGLYEQLGFTVRDADARYARPAAGNRHG